MSATAYFHKLGNDGGEPRDFNTSYWENPENRCLLGDNEVQVYFGPVIRKIQDLVPMNGRGMRSLLEIGGGNGDLALHLQNQGYEVVLLDSEEIALEISRSRGLKAARSTGPDIFRNEDIAGCMFDCAYMTRVLEYPVMSEMGSISMLRSLARLLKRGSPIIVGTTKNGEIYERPFRGNPALIALPEEEFDDSPYITKVKVAVRA